MKRGLNSLASIAATAPFVGVFGTVLGIFNTFRGFGTEKSTIMAWTAKYLSDAMVPTALGLAVAIVASCFYKSLQARLENFDIEMKNASLELTNVLAHL
jgi:biopolymer transport protein TolQ